MQNRVAIKTYYPQPVDLPQGIERNVSLASSPKLVNNYKSLSERDKQSIDTKTLFYDMFFLSNYLICLGPPFYGFGNPLAIKYNKKKLRFKVYPQYNFRTPAIVSIAMDHPRSCNLEFVFRNFNIEVSYIHQPLSLAKVALSLVTHQKNNLPIWIKDWCSWHSRVHGVDRIVIYDNGSSYFDELDKILTDLDKNLEIILVNWPYKFGLIAEAVNWRYYYCQIGALNHFRLAFGNQTQWCINLDIDEFLYPSEEISLGKYLATQIQVKPIIELYHYLFPSGQCLTNQEPRFYHPRVRYKEDHWDYRFNCKYICQPSAVTMMENHEVCFTTPRMIGYLFATMMKDYEVFTDSLKSLTYYRCVQYERQIQYKQQLTWSIIWSILMLGIADISKRVNNLYKLLKILLLRTCQPLGSNLKAKKQTAPLNKLPNRVLFFGHFRDLYLGWRMEEKVTSKNLYFARRFQRIDKTDPHHLVLDDRIAKKAIEVGMVKESEITAIK